MATYNTTLQTNNATIQKLIEAANKLPDAANSALKLQNKSVTPKAMQQVLSADDEYDGLGSVTVAGDVNLVSENIKHGINIFGIYGKAGFTPNNVVDSILDGTLSGSYSNDEVLHIGEAVFAGCEKLTGVDFPQVTTIGSSAFYNCARLTSVSFPQVTTISSYAFAYCSNLTSISFPKATTIGGDAFYLCSRLTSVSFPVATTISNYAFASCSSLTSVSFPQATTIGGAAFNHCSSLTSVSFPLVTSIGGDAFYRCSSLTFVSFPQVTTISSYAFAYCSSLTSVSFPRVTTIDYNAFYSCSSLTSVSFPLVKNIGSSAFQSCSKLTSVTLGASSIATLSNANAFINTPMSDSTYTGSFGSIYVPGSLVEVYRSATNWATYADRITAILGATITFTIAGVSYHAKELMTWKQWCSSEYNVNNYTCNIGVQSNEGNRLYNGSSLVFASDIITEGTAYAYSSSDGIASYFISYDLSDATLSSTQASIKSGNVYTTAITTTLGYPADVIVTMGGTDITNTAFDGDTTIRITSITGDIVIVVAERLVNFLPTATDTDRIAIYNDIGYYNGMRWSKSGGKIVTGNTTTSMTGFIPCKPGDVLRIYNYTRQSGIMWYIITFDDNQNVIQCIEHGGASPNGTYESPGYAETTLSTSKYGAGFTSIRLSWGQFNDDSIVTINQEIPAWSNQ